MEIYVRKFIPVFVLLFTFLLVACQPGDNSSITKEKITLHIDGMMCEQSCGRKIKKELLEIPGVKEVVVNYQGVDKDNSVSVTYVPDESNVSGMKEKIERIGGGDLYRVTKTVK